MIPILFNKNETAFTSNGIGRLVDCISCTCTEERNGVYEVEFEYPVSGKLFHELITSGGIIGVIHDDNHDIQPFDIYGSSAEINGVVTFYAHHISYRLNNVIVSPYTAANAGAAIAGISSHSINANPFSFSTDKNVVADFAVKHPSSVRSILFGEQDSILDIYGEADFKFDKWDVQMLRHRGADTGVTVRYGKNMIGIEAENDESETFNAIVPYWTDGENYVNVNEVVTPTTPITPLKVAVIDLSDKFQEKPTASELKTEAKKLLDDKRPWIPDSNIKVDFVALWQMPESFVDPSSNIQDAFRIVSDGSNDYLEPIRSNTYVSQNDLIVLSAADITNLEKVGLCDTVSIYWTDLGIVSQKAKVIRVVFDVLAERFTKIEVGTPQTEHVAIDYGGAGNSSDSSSDIADIKSKITTGANVDSNAFVRLEAWKAGRVCTVTGVITVKAVANSHIFTIDQSLAPTRWIDFAGYHSSGKAVPMAIDNSNRHCFIQSTGYTAAAGNVRFEVSWTI